MECLSDRFQSPIIRCSSTLTPLPMLCMASAQSKYGASTPPQATWTAFPFRQLQMVKLFRTLACSASRSKASTVIPIAPNFPVAMPVLRIHRAHSSRAMAVCLLKLRSFTMQHGLTLASAAQSVLISPTTRPRASCRRDVDGAFPWHPLVQLVA